jgi:hypothetical protein
MSDWQIILALPVFLTGCHPWSAQQLAPAAPPLAAPYPTTSAPVVVIDQSVAATGPMMVQPAPQGVPVLPPQSTVVPLPSHTPGSIFGPPAAPTGAALSTAPETLPPPPGVVGPVIPGAVPQPPVAGVPVSPLADVAPGGMVSPQFGLPPGPELPVGPGNPIAVPAVDEELAWDQITDVVADYFTIAREQRARRSGEVWTEGRIETAPQDGATWLEPHRGDSVGAFNRWESTFQTIRRRATIRVIPDANGYLVEAIVEKELEDLRNPEKATAGASTFRNDNSLPSRRLEEVSRTRLSPRWIQLGRDPALEQRLLAEIHARLTGVTTRSSIFAR